MPKRKYYDDTYRYYSNGVIEKKYKDSWRPMKGRIDTGGYKQATIHSSRVLWHRFIWSGFRGVIPDGLTINHKDEVKTNNSLDNLELLTQGDNDRYGTRIERSAEKHKKPVIGINISSGYVSEFDSAKATEQFGFIPTKVTACCKGRAKAHKGWKFFYA